MANVDSVAHKAEALLSYQLHATGYDVVRTTPSVKAGRRYIGVVVDGKEYLVTLEVNEAE